MAHKVFAELDANNNVVNTIVVDEKTISREVGDPSSERICKKLFKGHSYKESITNDSSDSFRIRPASVGGIYNSTNDRFEDAQVYTGWSKRSSDGEWIPPFDKPTTKPTEIVDHNNAHPDRAPLEIIWNNEGTNWQIGYMDFDADKYVKFNWGESDSDWVRSETSIPEGVTE